MADIAERVTNLIAEHLGLPKEDVTPAKTWDDLGVDSLDRVELAMASEEEFDLEIPDDALERIETVKDLIAFVEKSAP